MDTNYLTIQGWMVSKLELSGNDLLTYALIYGFSQDGETEFTGSINYITKWLNCSRPTAIKALKNLTERGYLLKSIITINGVSFNRYKVDLGVVKKLNSPSKNDLSGSKESLQGVVKNLYMGSKETLPNNTINTIIDNIDNNRTLESEQSEADRMFENRLTENQQSEIEQLLSKEELSKEYTKEINKEKHVPKKLTDKEITDKFLYWFNKRYLFHKGKESKYRKLDPTDLNNYKSLMKLYTDPKDWNHAFAMMLENEWVQENGTGTPGHFLVNANFQRYLNKTSVNKKNVYVAQNDLN